MNRVVAEKFSAFSAVTVGTTPVNPFTAFSGLGQAVLSFEGSAMRYRMDGVTAHSASGHLVSAGVYLNLQGSDVIQGFSVICTNTTGTIMASIGDF